MHGCRCCRSRCSHSKRKKNNKRIITIAPRPSSQLHMWRCFDYFHSHNRLWYFVPHSIFMSSTDSPKNEFKYVIATDMHPHICLLVCVSSVWLRQLWRWNAWEKQRKTIDTAHYHTNTHRAAPLSFARKKKKTKQNKNRKLIRWIEMRIEEMWLYKKCNIKSQHTHGTAQMAIAHFENVENLVRLNGCCCDWSWCLWWCRYWCCRRLFYCLSFFCPLTCYGTNMFR